MRRKVDPVIMAKRTMGQITGEPFTREKQKEIYEKHRREYLANSNLFHRLIFYIREKLSPDPLN